MPSSPFVFEPLFTLLRRVFATTDVCVGLIPLTLAVFVGLQLWQWNQYRQAFHNACATRDYRGFFTRSRPAGGFRFVPPLATAPRHSRHLRRYYRRAGAFGGSEGVHPVGRTRWSAG